ncbi:MAG: Lpg1974 family pore-forming outer membrane protein [Candidatus Paceibacterota bacterium]
MRRTLHVATVFVLMAASVTSAQDVQEASFHSYAARIEQLEAEVAAMKGRVGPGMATAELTCDSRCRAPHQCSCEDSTYGLYGGAALVVAKLHFKEAFQATTLDAATGTLNLVPFDYDYEPNARGWLGYQAPNGLGVRATYAHLDQAAQPFSQTSTPTSIHSAQVVTVNIPAVITANPGETLSVLGSLNVEMLDFEGTLHTHVAGMDLTVGGGLRYATLDQDSIGTVVTGGTATQQLIWERKYSGLGPAVSAEVLKPIGRSGLSLYGLGRGSLLFGDKMLNRFVNPPTGAMPPVPFVSLADGDEVVPIFDLGLGAQWSRQYDFGELFARATYEGQLWAEAGAPTLGFLGFEAFTVQIGLQR